MWGFKFTSDKEETILEQNWFDYNPKQDWMHYEVQEGKKIIGVYGDMDQSTITALGFLIWIPNPNAVEVKNLRAKKNDFTGDVNLDLISRVMKVFDTVKAKYKTASEKDQKNMETSISQINS